MDVRALATISEGSNADQANAGMYKGWGESQLDIPPPTHPIADHLTSYYRGLSSYQ